MPEYTFKCCNCDKAYNDRVVIEYLRFGSIISNSDIDEPVCECGCSCAVRCKIELPMDNSFQWAKFGMGIKRAPKGKEAAKREVEKHGGGPKAHKKKR